jgi:two-component system nitrate/nitrite response regulator NarP
MTSRVLIVDDHPMIRSAVAMLLEGSEFTVAASAGSAESATDAIRVNDPDMIILDLAMPGGSGMEVLKRLRADGDKTPVIILTAAIDDFRLREAMALRVDGIVMKNNDPAFLLDCLQVVRAGGRWFDPTWRSAPPNSAPRGPHGPDTAGAQARVPRRTGHAQPRNSRCARHHRGHGQSLSARHI